MGVHAVTTSSTTTMNNTTMNNTFIQLNITNSKFRIHMGTTCRKCRHGDELLWDYTVVHHSSNESSTSDSKKRQKRT